MEVQRFRDSKTFFKNLNKLSNYKKAGKREGEIMSRALDK